MAKPVSKARKRVKKHVVDGVAHIHASFNNTIIISTVIIQNTLQCVSCLKFIILFYENIRQLS